MRYNLLDATVVGLWLGGIFGSRFVWHVFLNQPTFPIYIAVIQIIWPLVYFAITGIRIIPSGLKVTDVLLLSLFSFSAIISCLFSPTPLFSLGYFLITLNGIYISLLINKYLSDSKIAQSIKLYFFLTTPLLIYLLVIELTSQGGARLGRETDILNPNSIAMIAMSIVVSSLIFKNIFILAVGQLTGIATIYFTGSRAAALGGLVAIAIGSYRRVRSLNRASQVAALLCMILLIPLVLYFETSFFLTTADKFFLWSDPHRGIESGMSGRLYIWGQMVKLIQDNWIVGVGFRAHESFIEASSAHNGYLATMAEIGLLGFGAIMAFIIIRQIKLFLHWRLDAASAALNVLFPLSVGYLLIAVFERYLINVGNPVSLLFLMALLRPAVTRQTYRPAESLNALHAIKS